MTSMHRSMLILRIREMKEEDFNRRAEEQSADLAANMTRICRRSFYVDPMDERQMDKETLGALLDGSFKPNENSTYSCCLSKLSSKYIDLYAFNIVEGTSIKNNGSLSSTLALTYRDTSNAASSIYTHATSITKIDTKELRLALKRNAHTVTTLPVTCLIGDKCDIFEALNTTYVLANGDRIKKTIEPLSTPYCYRIVHDVTTTNGNFMHASPIVIIDPKDVIPTADVINDSTLLMKKSFKEQSTIPETSSMNDTRLCLFTAILYWLLWANQAIQPHLYIKKDSEFMGWAVEVINEMKKNKKKSGEDISNIIVLSEDTVCANLVASESFSKIKGRVATKLY